MALCVCGTRTSCHSLLDERNVFLGLPVMPVLQALESMAVFGNNERRIYYVAMRGVPGSFFFFWGGKELKEHS